MLGLNDAGLSAAQAFISGAPELIAKLQASGMTVEADLVAGMHGAATDLVSQAVSGLLKVEGPVLDRIDALNKNIADGLALLQKFQAFAGGFSIVPLATVSTPASADKT